MAKKFPKTLYVKIEKDSAAEYFVADEDAASLVDMGDAIALGKYQLIEISAAKGVAQFGPPKRPR